MHGDHPRMGADHIINHRNELKSQLAEALWLLRTIIRAVYYNIVI